jgi:hypothetical protein
VRERRFTDGAGRSMFFAIAKGPTKPELHSWGSIYHLKGTPAQFIGIV